MKAIRVHEFGGPEQLRLEDAADPRVGPGQVVVRIGAAGVNPVETYIRTGTHAVKPELPYTPGSDGGGEVVAVGLGVEGFKSGNRVYVAGSISGTYAELALCDATNVFAIPNDLTFAQAAAVGIPYATAYRGLHQRATTRPGETVLVHGASGGVGLAAVQLGVAHGCRVIGTAGSDAGRQLVAAQGADHVLDHHADGYLDELTTLTDGRGVDVILEMLANVNLGRDLTVLAKGGRVVVIGSRGTVEINPRDTMLRDASIHGMILFNASDEDRDAIHAGLGAGLRNGTLRPIVGKELGLAAAAEAHEAVLAPGAKGKIVLLP